MKYLMSFFALVFTVLLTACSSENEAEKNPLAGEVIQLNAYVKGYDNIQTRVNADNAGLQNNGFVNGSKIFLFGTFGGYKELEYKSETAKFEYTGEPAKFPPLASLDLYAVHPVKDIKGTSTLEATDNTYFYVAEDQSNIENYRISDLMFANATNVSSNPVALNFRHMHTKVIVKLNGGFDNTSTIKLKNVVVAGHYGTPTYDASFNLSTSPSNISEITMGKFDSSGQTAIILPQKISADTPFIEVSNGSKTLTYNAPAGGITFKKGHVYTFDLTYNGGTILETQDDLSVTGWTNSNDDDVTQHEYSGDLN